MNLKNKKEKRENLSKIFKDKLHQFQEKFNFEGRKNKISKMTKNKGYHFSKKISNFKRKKKKKKKLFQRTTRIKQGFPSKGEIKSKKRERGRSHISR